MTRSLSLPVLIPLREPRHSTFCAKLWLSVDGTKISVETEGKAALRDSMVRYFRSCPTCKSSLEWIQKAGSRVTAVERASWSAKSGAKSQSGLSVYEFRGDKILRVYYFPAEVDKVPLPAETR